ncbi:MAG: hypothetical protein ACO3GM_03610 [Candidatus Limnocylindrus sp.]
MPRLLLLVLLAACANAPDGVEQSGVTLVSVTRHAGQEMEPQPGMMPAWAVLCTEREGSPEVCYLLPDVGMVDGEVCPRLAAVPCDPYPVGNGQTLTLYWLEPQSMVTP